MRKFAFTAILLALGVCALPSEALAITCPSNISGFSRQYTLEASASCVYGDGNINGDQNDEFLAGNIQGSNGPAFPLTGWSQSNNSLTGPVNGTSSGTWAITPTAGEQYAIGLKDGGDPKWAVFLIAVGTTSGTWSITGGGLDALSHAILYERSVPTTTPPTTPTTEPQTPGPEPTTLALLGAGLALAGRQMRRRAHA